MENQTLEEKTQQIDKKGEPSSNHVVLSSDDEEEAPYNDKQIVLYDPEAGNLQNKTTTTIPEPQPCPIRYKAPVGSYSNHGHQRVLPSVGAFTVQCALCFKWRLIPTKEKYEEIREHIMVQPFTCDLAKEWRAEVSCDTPGDIEQDNTRLWAIDKPSIAQPPPGWERELRIRGEGSSKFADVYYISPLGKRLRSMVEVQKYLFEHPEFLSQGVTLSQFSFQIPKPMQENYVRKRAPRLAVPGDSNFGMPRPLRTIEASPISWVSPTDPTTLQLARIDDFTPPAKKKARSSIMHTHKSSQLQHSPHNYKIKSPHLPPNGGVYEF